MKHTHFKRLVALILAFTMVMGLGVTGASAAGDEKQSLSYEKLDSISADLFDSSATLEETDQSLYADDEIVRVTIVMEEDPAIVALGGNADTYSLNQYRDMLKAKQQQVATDISREALSGRELDAVWHLTLAANAISANVEYGKISKIEKVSGVKAVIVETKYMPLSSVDTNNIISQQMTGASSVHAAGYTGVGQRIAIIDTGVDTDHQSFAEDAFLYSYDLHNGDRADLLDAEDIAEVFTSLNAYAYAEYADLDVSGEDLYISSKIPFGFNYIDYSLDVTHDNDTQGSHGSHVAGIAAANDYVSTDRLYDFDGDRDFDLDDVQALMDYVVLGTSITNIAYADISGDGAITDYDAHIFLEKLNDSKFLDADEAVNMSGVAPDAQIIAMKIFGAGGGAYESDYIAAIEDAVSLGCDTINLSLGAAYPGFTHSYSYAYYDAVFKNLEEETGVVVCIAAGNSGNWADDDSAYQLMYADEAGTSTTGNPATYTNSLAVASADNTGSITDLKTVFTGDASDAAVSLDFASVSVANGQTDTWHSLDPAYTGTEYEAVFLGDPSALFAGETQTDSRIYAGSADDFAGYDFTGKVVFVARGTYNFADKHLNAATAGAAAVVIYNNVDGTIYADLTGSTATAPCATISLAEAKSVFALFTKNSAGLYTGTLTVKRGVEVNWGEENSSVSMSSFSSWGTTGALTIKPEITAPGGGIYSVNGVDQTGGAYENMSGTSMATPHISGLAALAMQHVEKIGLNSKFGHTNRQLVQSLMMSTAEPLIEESSGVEYSVRNQGSGLANIQNVVSAQSYIMVDGQDDGKVKAELGEMRTGTASFAFTIYNFGSSAQTYDLSASILTPGTTVIDGYALSTDEMVELDADVTFSTGSTVTVAAGQSKKVNVTISVSEATATALAELGHTNGFYVEGYVYAKPQATAEGVQDVTHSIPLLGWYGNWTDPSMFDTGSYIDFYYDNDVRPSHIFDHMYSGDSTYKNFLALTPTYYTYPILFSGSLYGDKSYNEERNALNLSADRQFEVYGIFPTLIRNAVDFDMVVTDETGKIWYQDDWDEGGNVLIGNFYYNTYWYDQTTSTGITVDDWSFGEEIPEDTHLTITFRAIPEYYVCDEGTYFDGFAYSDEYGADIFDHYELPDSAWTDGTIGDGAFLSWSFTVDNTAPTLSGDDALVLEGNTLSFCAQDNNYVAAVVLMTGDGTGTLEYYYPDMPTSWKGKAITGSFDLTGYAEKYGDRAVLAVCDYAGNESYYAVNLNGIGESFGDLVAFQYNYNFLQGLTTKWVAFQTGVEKDEYTLFSDEHTIVAAEYVNGFIFAQDNSGKLYGIDYNDMMTGAVTNLESTYITTLSRVYQDFAYSYADGKLYALSTIEEKDGYPTAEIYSINLNGEYYDSSLWQTIGAYEDAYIAQRGGLYGLGLAADDSGSVYVMGTVCERNWDYDESNPDDVPYFWSETAHLWCFQQDNWGTLGISTDLGDTGIPMDYLQSMTWDHNSETLYWAQFYTDREDAILYTVDPVTVENEGVNTITCTKVGVLSGETCAMFAPLTATSAAKDAHQNVPNYNLENAGQPILSTDTLTMGLNTSETLVCSFDPWYSLYTDVSWTSSNESVATVKNGVVTAVGEGQTTITVTNNADPSKFATCTVSVVALSLEINGTFSVSSGGVATVSNSYLYKYTLDNGKATMTVGDAITAPDELNMGLQISTALEAKGSIWASEWNNTGMIYQMNSNGVVVDAIQPIDGGHVYGLSYSEKADLFSGIMNFYFFADLGLNHEDEDDMLASYDPVTNDFTWHRIDMSGYLAASDTGFATGESGQGSIVDVVFCGITDINEPYTYESDSHDYLGNLDWNNSLSYTSDVTHVLLDNVGRLWYIDEIYDLNMFTDDYGNTYYFSGDDVYDAMDAYISYGIGTFFCIVPGEEPNGFFTLEKNNADGTTTASAFYIRKIEETPLTTMYRNGTMPRYSYAFSDLCYLGKSEEGAPMFLMSLYDYWNNGKTNDFYLYVGGVGTGEYEIDYSTWSYVEIMTPSALYSLGNTGDGNLIATITSARYIGGLPTSGTTEAPEATTLYYIPSFFGA